MHQNSSLHRVLVLLWFLACAPNGLGQISTNPLPGRVLVKMLADPDRPLVYALNAGDGSTTGSLLALDATNGAVVLEVSTGRYPTDMALGAFGTALYVIQTGSRTISRFQPGTLALVAEKSITTPGTYNPTNPLHLAAGRNDLVYFTDGAWAPTITVFDFAQSQVVGGFDDGNGVGGLAIRREGIDLYAWRQYGWGAGNVNSYVTHLDVSGVTPVARESSFSSWRRDPLDTPILFDAAERWVFNKQQMFDARDVSVVVNQFTENVYAVSLDGSVAFGSTRVFNTGNAVEIANLGTESSVQVLSTDQRRLFRWASGRGLMVHDMLEIASVAGPDPVPVPADGALLGASPATLSWSASQTALSYDVYWSTNATAVATASTNSAAWLVRTRGLSVPLPTAQSPGQAQYWRVDRVGFGGQVRPGPVWSFTVSPLQINPTRLEVDAIRGHAPRPRTLRILTAGIPWTARTAGANWLRVNPGSGTTAGDLTIEFDTTSLPVGIATNALEIAFEGQRITLPVSVSVKPLLINRMAAEPGRPWIYATQPSAQPGQSGYLLRIDADTGVIDDLLPIGSNPTDLAIHGPDRRIYVANWGNAKTEVVDLDSFGLLAPLQLGTDVYRINPGPKGRLIVEGFDQWIEVTVHDSATGANVGRLPFPQREGDGETSPDGVSYYHADNNISNAAIHKYSLGNLTAIAHSPEHPFGSRNLVMSADGSRLFWQGSVFTSNLVEEGSLGAQILAASRDGSVALSANKAYDVAQRLEMAALPSVATTGVVDSSDRRFWYFDAAAGTLRSVSLDALRSPSITDQPKAQPTREGSPVYLSVTARGLSPLAFQWSHAGTNLPGATNRFFSIDRLEASQVGQYTVTVTNRYGRATSDPIDVIALAPPRWIVTPADTNVLAGGTLMLGGEVSGTPPIRFAWSRDGIDMPGMTNAWLTLTDVQAEQEGLYQVRASNSVGVAVGPYIRVRIIPSAPRITAHPLSLSLRAGGLARFEARAAGSRPMSLQWLSNGVAIPGATEAILHIPAVGAANAGAYRLSASNALDVAQSQTATLTIMESAPVIVEQPFDQSVRVGMRALITTRVEGSVPMAFRWFRDGMAIPGNDGPNLILTNITMASAGLYRLEVSNALGTATSAEARLIVQEAPVLVAGLVPTLVSRGSELRLSVEVRATPAVAYSWTRNGIAIAGGGPNLTITSVGPADTGVYTVIATNVLGALTNRALVVVQAPPSGVRTWGDDVVGQSDTPADLSDAVQVVGGDYHSVALRAGGSLVAWGLPMDGRTTPPETGRRWFAIAAGGAHTLGVMEDGNLAGFGRNEARQLDLPRLEEPAIAVAAGDAHSLALTSRGRIVVWGDNSLGQLQAPATLRQIPARPDSPTAVAGIAAGRHHSLALLKNGSVVAWGGNLRGESTVPTTLTEVTSIAAGRLHSVALSTGGTVIVWGDDSYGQTRVPSALRDVVAIAAGDFHTLALRADGSIVAWGDDSFGQCALPSGSANVVAIGSGHYHGLALVPTSPRLHWLQSATGLKLWWNGSGILQTSTEAGGPYTDLSHGEQEWGPVPVENITSRFFRIRP